MQRLTTGKWQSQDSNTGLQDSRPHILDHHAVVTLGIFVPFLSEV